MTVSYATYPKFKAWAPDGVPAAGYLLYTKLHGTLIHKRTFSDSGLTTENPEEVELDDEGEADLYLENGVYDFILKTPAGADYRTFGPIEGQPITLNNVLILDKVADLILYRETDGLTAIVSGYHAAGDGRAFREFYYDSTSSATPNPGTVFYGRDELATGRWLALVANERVTPFKFGAKGDNSTNDYAAFLAANNYCASFTNKKTLYIDAPSAKYLLGSAMTFTCPVVGEENVTLKTTNLNISFSNNVELNGPTFDLGTGTVTIGAGFEGTGPVFTGVAGVTFTDPTIIDSDWFTSSQFKVMIDSAGANTCQIIVDKDFTLTANTTVPSNVYLNFVSGVIDCSTYQLTINSPVGDVNRQIFSGRVYFKYVNNVSGTIVPNQSKVKVNLLWFGFKGVVGGSTDGVLHLPQSQETMSANVEAFMQATYSAGNGILSLTGRDVWYGINSTIVPGGMVLKTALTGITTSVQVDIIPKGTPQTGTLKIQKNILEDESVAYTSWSGNTFTIASTNFTSIPCSVGNVVRDSTVGSAWLFHGEEASIYWGGVGGGKMFEVSNPENTINELKTIKIRGWHNADETTNHALIGLNYGRTMLGNWHYYFSQVTWSNFMYNDLASPMYTHPNGGGGNGANDFEYLNCYFASCSNGIVIGMPDQSFVNCTFQGCKWAFRLAPNSRVTLYRCYLGAERAVFMIGGIGGISAYDCWSEQIGTLIEYITPGNYFHVPSGINLTNFWFACTGTWDNDSSGVGNVGNGLVEALTGVPTKIVSQYVQKKESLLAWGMPNSGFVDPYDNTGTIRRVQYGERKGYTLNGALSGATVTSVIVAETINTMLPSSGCLTITLASGAVKSIYYSSYTGSTFTISSTDFSSDNAPNGTVIFYKSMHSYETTSNITGASVTSIPVSTTIDALTPASGSLMIVTDGGVEKNISYTSWSGSSFTIASTNFSSDNASAGAIVHTKVYSNLTVPMRLASALNSAGTTSVVVSGVIPSHTPNSGTLRIELNSGVYKNVAYSAKSGSTFTISSTDFSGVNVARIGREVNASVDFNSVPCNAGNLLQLQQSGSFLDLRDVGGNVVIKGGTFDSRLKPTNITLKHADTSITIEDVTPHRDYPMRFINTYGKELSGHGNSYIRQNGAIASGVKSRQDYSTESDLISFSIEIPTTGLADNDSATYGSISVPGVRLVDNRPDIQIYFPSSGGLYAHARVTADDVIEVSILNMSGANLTTSTNVYGTYTACDQLRLLD